MKIFKTLVPRIVLIVTVLTLILNTTVLAKSSNPSQQELEKMIEEVAIEKAVPSVLLKAIARVESGYRQFRDDGTVLMNDGGSSIGIMMVNNRHGGYDLERLKYDIEYNIEAGAEVLLTKWNMSTGKQVSSVGDMNPNVLENWYFAIWAYNGWVESNNPNMIPYNYSSWVKRRTFQQLVYEVCKNEYNQNINYIDYSYLPSSGNPSRSLVVPTPTNNNLGGIILYEVGDLVKTNKLSGGLYLRDQAGGQYTNPIDTGQMAKIIEGPVFKDGYYWYKISVNDIMVGWIERNWIECVGDTTYGVYPFDDIPFHWARKNIMKLYSQGKIGGVTENSFMPDKLSTREEFCVFLSKVLDLKNNEEKYIEKNIHEEYSTSDEDETFTQDIDITNKDTNIPTKQNITNLQLQFADADEISPWANEHIENVYQSGMLNGYNEYFKPNEILTRKEAAVILSHVFTNKDLYNSKMDKNEVDRLDITQIFNDLTGLTQAEIDAVKAVYVNGLVSGKVAGKYCPDEHITRAEAATIMNKIDDRLAGK